MKAAIRTAATQLARGVPVALWRRLLPKTALGVCYHIVSDTRVPHVRHYPILDTAAFASDLSELERKFGWITYDDLARRRSAQDHVRDNAVILTFDDGFAECATVVAPILRDRRINCVCFVITDLIDNHAVFRETEASLCIEAIGRLSSEQLETIVRDLGLDAPIRRSPVWSTSDVVRPPLENAGLNDLRDPRLRGLLHWLLTIRDQDATLLRQLASRLNVDPEGYVRAKQPYLTSAQILQLRSDGFTIGAHSCSHRLVQDLPREEAAREIVESCRVIRDLTGQASVPFAFPYHGGGVDRNWLAQLKRDHDFIGLFFDTGGLREDHPFIVQRVFGERLGWDRTLDAILRRAWARPSAWRRSS